jgi:phosphopentomutase
MIYGHRRDVEGYFRAVAEIDAALPALRDAMAEGDLLIITADHGCDPTFRGTDHTREHVPLLVYRKGANGRDLGARSSFTDVAATVGELLGCHETGPGSSFSSSL